MKWAIAAVLFAGAACSERALPAAAGGDGDGGYCPTFTCRSWYVTVDGGVDDAWLERLSVNDELCFALCDHRCGGDEPSCRYEPDDGGARVRCATPCL